VIEYTFDEYLSTITINRPEKANALTPDMLRDLKDAAIKARGSRAVILTGVGKIFSAGADLEFIDSGIATDPTWEELSQTIADLPGLTICALNGTLAGGAFGMALACDLRIAVPDARFFYPVVEMGVLPQPSDPVRMKTLIGPSRTKMLLLAGQKIDSQIAQRWGLIDNTTTPGGLMDHALTLAAAARATPFQLLKSIKGSVEG
jgi:enoyl-CoA hydratase/carnithine racemase